MRVDEVSLRAALVGLGAMGKNHFRVLSSLPGVDLVAVVEPRANQVTENSTIKVLESVQELKDFQIDFVVVATPTVSHEKICLELMEMGFHVLVEKPIAASVPEAKRMAASARQNKRIGGVGHIERFNPAIVALRQQLRLGLLGDIHQITTRRQSAFPSRVSDVGVIMDLGSHDFDLVPWVTGSPYDFIFCQTAQRAGRNHEDLMVLSGCLTDGTIVNHVVNWVSPIKERVVTVVGERGTLVANTISGDLTFFENGSQKVEWDSLTNFTGLEQGQITRLALEKREPLVLELEGFRDAILSMDGSFVCFDEGVEVMRVIQAAFVSAKSSNPVSITSQP